MGYRDGEVEHKHESFGQVSIVRATGVRNLHGVDWPVGHYMLLTIHTGRMSTDSYGTRYSTDKEIVQIALSEVQFAQVVTGVGFAEGVPCTIRRRQVDGAYRSMEEPPTSTNDQDGKRAHDGVEREAKQALEGVAAARKELLALLNAPGTPKKSDLKAIYDRLHTGERAAVENLPYVVQSSHERVNKQVDRAKGEVQAYVGFAKQRLGEEALARAAAYAVEHGGDPVAALLEVRPEPRDEA